MTSVCASRAMWTINDTSPMFGNSLLRRATGMSVTRISSDEIS